MTLNDIQLPPQTISDLYRKLLINPDEKTETVITPENKIQPSSAYLGNNKKQIAVVVSYPSVAFIPDEQLAFLTTILAACKLNLDDIALVNFEKWNGSYKDLQVQLGSKAVLLFGLEVSHISLPLKFPLFQVQHFDGVNYIASVPLDEIEKDKALKSQLWTGLKKIFNLK